VSYYDPSIRMRAPRGTFTPSPIFICLVVLFLAAGALAWLGKGSDGVIVFFFVVLGWVVSLCLHEYAHAVIAYHAGDRGVAHRGYLQLNPLKYTNPIFSIALPLLFIILGGIGLPGGAVMIDHSNVRNKRLDSMISLAGPAVNLILAGALVVPFGVGVDTAAHPTFWAAVAYLAFFQLMAGIFNLLPVPGLDGGNAIYPWLKYDGRRGFDAVRPYGYLLVFVLLWQPTFNRLFFGWLYSLISDLGVPLDVLGFGQYLFRFWSH